jgi:Protein of unknown function (DUF2815)
MAHFVTPEAVLSFPALFVPKPRTQAPGAELFYSCSLLFGPEARKTPEWKALQQGVIDAAKAKLGANVNIKTIDNPFRDGAEKDYSGYGPGVIYISPRSKGENAPPGVVDKRLQKVIDPARVYSGAIVRASVTPFAWNFQGKKGVSFGLNHIQLVNETAPRIDGRVSAEKAFSPIEDLEDELVEEASPF